MLFNIINKRKFIIILIIIILVGSFYMGYRLYKVWEKNELSKESLGYKTQCKYLTNKVFRRGEWLGVLIDLDISYTDGAHNIIPYDLDNDGKIELIANSYRSDTLLIYKYKNDPYDSSNWVRYPIDLSVGGGIPRKHLFQFIKALIKEKLLGVFRSGAHYTAIADMNNGRRDDLILAGDLKRNDIVWYETPEDITELSSYKKHAIYRNSTHRTYHVETGDIDGDGYLDIVFSTKTDNSIGWLRNDRSLNEWPLTWVDKMCVRSFNVRIVDIDKNGLNDIIASEDDSINGGNLQFYSYSGNSMLQKNWIKQTIANFPSGHGVSIFEIMDIDHDGDSDIVTGNHQGDVYVLVNAYPDKALSEWEKHKITSYTLSSGHDFREIDVGDIDNDGDNDIIVADEGRNMIIWFENPKNIYSGIWLPHIIDESNLYLKWCHSVELGDIDGDGDLDVAVAAAGSNIFLLYFNNINN